MKMNVDKPSIGPLSAVVILTTLAVAGIHLYLVPEEFSNDASGYAILFILAGVGSLLALVVMYAPWSTLAPLRGLARLALVGIALASIITYLALGFFDTLGWITKVIEAVLVVAAVAEVTVGREDRHEAHTSTAGVQPSA